MRILTIGGYTGTEDDGRISRMHEAVLTEIQRKVNAGEMSADDGVKAYMRDLDEHYGNYGCALYHNSMARPMIRYNELRRLVRQLARQAYSAYNDLSLSTTTAWHAAHHRYVLACNDAHDAYENMIIAAEQANEAFHAKPRYVTLDYYLSKVDESERLTAAPELISLRAERDAFVAEQRKRFAITAHTLAGTMPTKFQYEPEPEPAGAGDDSEDQHGGPDHMEETLLATW